MATEKKEVRGTASGEVHHEGFATVATISIDLMGGRQVMLKVREFDGMGGRLILDDEDYKSLYKAMTDHFHACYGKEKSE